MKNYNIAVVGATGLVGKEMVKILAEKNLPIGELRLFASSHSAGESLAYKNEEIVVEELRQDSFIHTDYALFSAGTEVSRNFIPQALQSDCVVIDNSKVYRMDAKVPLIVPEINGELLKTFPKLIANPNCSTIQLTLALKPIFDEFGIEQLVISTYQSVSGAGKEGVQELKEQTKKILANSSFQPAVFPHQIAFNSIPQIDLFEENGYTLEEMKLINETRKILGDESIKINATAVRTPVFNGHCESVYVVCKKKVDLQKVHELLASTSGIKVLDNPKENIYPLAIHTEQDDHVLIGRIRPDLDNDTAFCMWIAANNLRKGAALNAVQILEAYIKL